MKPYAEEALSAFTISALVYVFVLEGVIPPFVSQVYVGSFL